MKTAPEIRPAILAKTKEEFQIQFQHLQPLGLTFHIDIMDGDFVPNKTWNDLIGITQILKNEKFEVHLMTKNPLDLAEAWLEAGAIRAIIHREAIDPADFLDPRRHTLAINPNTPIDAAHSFLIYDVPLMFMSVPPGWSGQNFDSAVLEKIKSVHKSFPSVSITVDGGIKPEHVNLLVNAGASTLVMGSYLSTNPDPLKAYQQLSSYE